MWVFKQSSGWLRLNSLDGPVVSTVGWAGQGEGRNNPAMQCVHRIGPLPRGLYTFTAPYEHPRLGSYVMNLIPDPANDMCGRGDFRIHGAAEVNPELSSEGCVVEPHVIRMNMWASDDHRLTVVE